MKSSHENTESSEYEVVEEASEYNVPVDLTSIQQRFDRIKDRYSDRDARMHHVRLVLEGRMSELAPDIFPHSGAFQEPIIANMIDVAARDLAELIAPLPTFTSKSVENININNVKRINQKTKIANGYISHSNLQGQMYNAAIWYVAYGFVPFKVEADYESQIPTIRAIDPTGCYPEVDRMGNIVAFYQRILINRDVLAAQFPEHEAKIKKNDRLYGGRTVQSSADVEVIFYHDKNWDLAYVADGEGFVLDQTPNKIGKVCIVAASRPGATVIPRGQFDDVIFTQLARAQFALLQMQAAHESVNAPIIVPNDVQDIPYGPGATIRTSNPQGVGRLPIEIPQSAFAEQQSLERELTLGARFPQTRTGNSDASIITGQGVKALEGGYETQVVAHQQIFAHTLQKLISLCFEYDEKVFGEIEKVLSGSENGTPFEVKYVANKIIKGDYSIDVKYGLTAGLNPNQALIFLLQAYGVKLFSKETFREELPFAIDSDEEKRKIDMEDLEEAAKNALLGYSQSIPALAAQGQDVLAVVKAISKASEDVRKGRSVIESIEEYFTPPEPTPEEQAAAAAQEAQGALAGMGGQPAPQGGIPMGAEQQAPPDIATLMASMNSNGTPNLSARVTQNRMI